MVLQVQGHGKPRGPIIQQIQGHGKPREPMGLQLQGHGKPRGPKGLQVQSHGKPRGPIIQQIQGHGKPREPMGLQLQGHGKPRKPIMLQVQGHATNMRILLLIVWMISDGLAQSLVMENVGYLNLPDCSIANINMFSDSAMKATWHEPTRLLYIAGDQCIHVVAADNPTTPRRIQTEYFIDGTDGRLVDIEVCGNTLAVLVENTFSLVEGHVYLCDLYDVSTNSIKCDKKRITVGHSPKSLKYSNDCGKLLVANEGRPGLVNGVFTDPEGSVSIIDMTFADTSAPCSRELTFSYFNSKVLEYLGKGLRWSYRGDHNNGIITQLSQDIEPEAITVSDDNTMAYVTLPENNAIAVINLVSESFVDIYPMGSKTWNTLKIDASDYDNGSFATDYAVKGLYQPTAAVYVKGATASYVVTANTGAMKTYSMDDVGVDFADNTRGRTALFGRAHISIVDGRDSFTELITDVHLFGGRDIGVWDPTNPGSFSYTTRDELEEKAAESFPAVFNGDCSNETLSASAEADSRSDDLGPEPNVLAAGTYGSVPMITAATRNGIIYLYTMPISTLVLNSVYRLGDVTGVREQLQGSSAAGDGLISDMGIIPQNVLGADPYLYVIARGTGTVSINRIYVP
ncbi:uncharacterized protein LOC132546789 [Ylistrum balloti]|uniref:uncharacterized protein LOC132546789 n=1 Tax=Ylistrum balloti TaxID=509963 RepID=UPI0029059D59|nr:uncharacterized protein LOC132546789 [Ylistrum balloti]